MSESTPFIKDVPDGNVKFSIIIPAHNEENYIGGCLESIAKAAQPYKDQVEVIVVLNRCTDKTKEIAQFYNCVTLENTDKIYLKLEMLELRWQKAIFSLQLMLILE